EETSFVILAELHWRFSSFPRGKTPSFSPWRLLVIPHFYFTATMRFEFKRTKEFLFLFQQSMGKNSSQPVEHIP
ncbi:MAG: hypothetical protein AB1556_13715, partial [Bacillota bacterium]